MRKGNCIVASLCLLASQSRDDYNAISVGSRKDYDEYLQKCLGKVTLAPPSSVVIEEIIESPVDSKLSDLGKGQAPPAIEG